MAGVERLAAAGFEPPHPTTLPGGPPDEVWAALTGRSEADLAALAGSLVDLPDPGEDPDLAARTLELLLVAPGERDRAARLLDRLAPHAAPDQVALWTFRLRAAALSEDEREDAEAWEALLAPLEAHETTHAIGLRLAASALVARREAHGAEWLAPVLAGRRVVNRAAALARRPSLREALAPAVEWLERADRLASPATEGSLEAELAEAEALDEAGRVDEASERLLGLLDRSADRPDLAAALGARATLLLSPTLGSRAAAHGARAEAPDTDALRSLARRPLPPPAVSAPEAPRDGWASRVRAVGGEAVPQEAEALAFLEAAGSRGRAARGWLARGGDDDLLHAWRLADALSEDGRSALVASLETRVPDDELVLAGDAAGRRLGRGLRTLLPEGAARTWLDVRLRAAGGAEELPDEPAAPPGEGPPVDPDDPHSAASRLAAAGDLLAADKPDAAASIVAALLRKLDDPTVTPHLLRVTLRLLALERPPEGIVGSAERAVLSAGSLGDSLLDRLTREPVAAFPLHGALHRAALDRRRTDAQRVRLLEAWLGIWRATGTPPDPASLSDLMHGDAALAPLAAARLAERPDPVADAARFLAAHPPLETPASAWSEALLALSRGET